MIFKYVFKVYHKATALEKAIALCYAEIKGVIAMTEDELCEAWNDLLKSPDRGRIYTCFDKNRKELIKHVQNCQTCKNRISSFTPVPISKLGSKTPEKFAEVIRVIYSKFKNQSA